MRPRWADHHAVDQATLRALTTFLDGRLEEKATVDWALRLTPGDALKRLALLDLIDSAAGLKIKEPWRSAWRLIEESWTAPLEEHRSSREGQYVYRRLRTGDRSGALIAAIVELVAPRLEVRAFSDFELHLNKPPKRPRRVEDLFSTGLTSGELLDPGELRLESVTDRAFLHSFASALENAVADGLSIALRNGMNEPRHAWRLGPLHRVYYVKGTGRFDIAHEPDGHGRGLGPSVKLLHEVVSRLVDVDLSAAVGLAQRWKIRESAIHLRLWASLSRDSRVSDPREVADMLKSMDDLCFWDLDGFPEVSEMRAKRFRELEPREQASLAARLRRRPPRKIWPKRANAAEVDSLRTYWALRELRRIEVAGGSLPNRDRTWMEEKIQGHDDLVNMHRVDEGFHEAPSVRSLSMSPDGRYDLLADGERLDALEASMKAGRSGWDEDPAGGASAWIMKPGNANKILRDLETLPDAGACHERVWETFGWAHSPVQEMQGIAALRDFASDCDRVLRLLARLPEATIREAINGISHWISTWQKYVVPHAMGLDVWLKLWPIAVAATNQRQPVEEAIRPSAVAGTSDDQRPIPFDTLNPPAGKLVGVFLAACPRMEGNDRPFDVANVPRRMRDAIMTATGRSRLIALHRMIESLPYFLLADAEWTHAHLITPLSAADQDAVLLWQAVARQTRFKDVLKVIGSQMAARATDLRLDRETRRSLVFSLVVECLHAFNDNREPAVSHASIQQMVRSLDDEVRAFGAEAIQRFVRDVSAPQEGRPVPPTPEGLFRSAVAPFLQRVWPQEASLSTPGISRALADLPVTAQGAFGPAVSAIERFLVPFECWSMSDYGFFGEENGLSTFSIISDREKADALLRLLNRTVGSAEGSVVPYNLADALEKIHAVAPDLVTKQAFRRLATAARR